MFLLYGRGFRGQGILAFRKVGELAIVSREVATTEQATHFIAPWIATELSEVIRSFFENFGRIHDDLDLWPTTPNQRE